MGAWILSLCSRLVDVAIVVGIVWRLCVESCNGAIPIYSVEASAEEI